MTHFFRLLGEVERSTSQERFQDATARSQGAWAPESAAASSGGVALHQRARRVPQVGKGG